MHPGDILGDRYRLSRRIGRGGMAEVFAATDTRLDREVAVKVIATHLGDDERASRRFEREVLAAAKLQHPNVVAVFDADVDHDQPYLVTELLEGGTLADRIGNGPFSPQDAAAIGAQIAAGLEAAHVQGMIHRDVKPANVLLAADGTAKVTDFGIVQALDRTATVTSSVYGSTPYVAPEQIRGEDADARTDVYALGCVLFEMLTGRPPFVADSPAGVIGQHLSAEIPRLDEHRPAELPAVGPELSGLVAACLAKQREARPGSMTDLRVALTRAAAGGATPTQRLADSTTVLLADDQPSAGTEPTALLDPADRSTPAPDPTAVLEEPPATPSAAATQEDATVAMPPDTTALAPDFPASPAEAAAPRAGRRDPKPAGRGAWIVLAVLLLALVWAFTNRGGTGTPEVAPVADTVSETPEPTPEPEADRTAEEAIADFRDHLAAGREADQINKREAERLEKDLDDVEKKRGEGKDGEAIDKVTDLQEKVDELREKNKIDPSLADALDDDLDALLRALVLDG